METQAIEKRDPGSAGSLRTMLEKSKDQIQLALPRHMTAERMIRVAMTAVQRQPKLLECTPLSVVGAVVEASQLGLEPDGILGQAYLVPYFNNKTKRVEAQLQPGYRGLIALARRSGEVSTIYAELVYEADTFKISKGDSPKLKHEPNYDAEDRGKLRGAYAVVIYKDGGKDFEYMPLAELDKIRQQSKAAQFGPWQTHPEEMYRKCPIRRLAKRLPLSPEFQRAAVLDEYVDAGVAPGMELDEALANAKPELGVASLKSRLKAAQQKEFEALPLPEEEPPHAPHVSSQPPASPPADVERAGASVPDEPRPIPNPYTGTLELHEGAGRMLLMGDDGTALALRFPPWLLPSVKQRSGKRVIVDWFEENGSMIAKAIRTAK